jgi:hypothetical protein
MPTKAQQQKADSIRNVITRLELQWANLFHSQEGTPCRCPECARAHQQATCDHHPLKHYVMETHGHRTEICICGRVI